MALSRLLDDSENADDYLDFVNRKGHTLEECAPEPGRMEESDITPAGAACIGLATSEIRMGFESIPTGFWRIWNTKCIKV